MLTAEHIAHIENRAASLAAGLTPTGLQTLFSITDKAYQEAPIGDDRTEMALVAAAYRNEIALRSTRKIPADR